VEPRATREGLQEGSGVSFGYRVSRVLNDPGFCTREKLEFVSL